MEIMTIKKTQIAYSRRTGKYGKENQKLMNEFKNLVIQHELFPNSTILGIAQNDPSKTPEEKCRYDICLLIDKNFPKVDNINIGIFEGGKYASFTIEHTRQAVYNWYNNLTSIIKENNLSPRNAPIVECYRERVVKEGYCEMLLPIK